MNDEINLLPGPFCGHEAPEFERMGTRRQSCIVICGHCGARHESSDEDAESGTSWNRRAAVAAQPEAGEAVGWKRVPVEPTSNMLAAMSGEWHSSRHEEARKQYAAMLASAPTIQPTQPVQEREAFAARWEHLAYMHSRGVPIAVMAHYIAHPDRLDYSAQLHREHNAATPAQAGDAGAPSDAATEEVIDYARAMVNFYRERGEFVPVMIENLGEALDDFDAIRATKGGKL